MSKLVPKGSQLTVGELVTLGVTYFTVGVAGSVIMESAGTEPEVILALAVLVNAITTPLAFIAVLGAGGSVLSALISGWLVASRFGLLASSLAPRLWPSRPKRAAAAFGAFDPNVAIALREDEDDSVRRVYVRVTLTMILSWYVGVILGLSVGDRFGDPDTYGLDAVLPAALLAIVWPQLRTRHGASIGALAAGIALVLLEITPGGVPALAAAGAALLALRPAEARS